MNHLNDKPMSLEEVADFFRIKLSYAYKVWRKWGIQPIKPVANSKLLFWRSDVIKLLEQPK
jgi:hypothetical protein